MGMNKKREKIDLIESNKCKLSFVIIVKPKWAKKVNIIYSHTLSKVVVSIREFCLYWVKRKKGVKIG
jgi:hypothetical protein